MNRVAVIGLDAVEPELVDKMIADGPLPALARGAPQEIPGMLYRV